LTDATFPAAEDEVAECKEDPLTLVVDNVVDLPSVIALDLISFSIFSLRAFSPSFNDTCPIVWIFALTGAAFLVARRGSFLFSFGATLGGNLALTFNFPCGMVVGWVYLGELGGRMKSDSSNDESRWSPGCQRSADLKR